MKRTNFRVVIALLAVVAVVVLAGPVERAQADSPDHADVNGFCSDNDDFGMSHGECVSITQTHVNALAERGNTDGVTICKVLQEVFGPFPLGDCVRRFAKY
jgi:hypothetical protein